MLEEFPFFARTRCGFCSLGPPSVGGTPSLGPPSPAFCSVFTFLLAQQHPRDYKAEFVPFACKAVGAQMEGKLLDPSKHASENIFC